MVEEFGKLTGREERIGVVVEEMGKMVDEGEKVLERGGEDDEGDCEGGAVFEGEIGDDGGGGWEGDEAAAKEGRVA